MKKSYRSKKLEFPCDQSGHGLHLAFWVCSKHRPFLANKNHRLVSEEKTDHEGPTDVFSWRSSLRARTYTWVRDWNA